MLKKFSFILTSCLSLLSLFVSNAKASHTENYILLNEYDFGFRQYEYYDPNATTVRGNIIDTRIIRDDHDFFYWQRAEEYGLWVNTHYVRDGHYHLSYRRVERFVINCSEGTYEQGALEVSGFLTPNDAMNFQDRYDEMTNREALDYFALSFDETARSRSLSVGTYNHRRNDLRIYLDIFSRDGLPMSKQSYDPFPNGLWGQELRRAGVAWQIADRLCP